MKIISAGKSHLGQRDTTNVRQKKIDSYFRTEEVLAQTGQMNSDVWSRSYINTNLVPCDQWIDSTRHEWSVSKCDSLPRMS